MSSSSSDVRWLFRGCVEGRNESRPVRTAPKSREDRGFYPHVRNDSRFLVCRIRPRASPTRAGDPSRYRQGCRSPRISVGGLLSGKRASSTTRSVTTRRTGSGPRIGSPTSKAWRGSITTPSRRGAAVRRPADCRPGREPGGMTGAEVDTAKVASGSDGDSEGADVMERVQVWTRTLSSWWLQRGSNRCSRANTRFR
jgi:hypothetical protein